MTNYEQAPGTRDSDLANDLGYLDNQEPHDVSERPNWKLMLFLIVLVLWFFVFILGIAPASASEVIITTTDSSLVLRAVGYDDGAGDVRSRVSQPFVPTQDGEITSINVAAYKDGTPVDDLGIYIYSNSGGEPGTLIGTGTGISPTGVACVDGAADYQVSTFATPVAVTNGTTYHVVAERTGVLGAVNFYHNCGEPGPPDEARGYNGSVWSSAVDVWALEITNEDATSSGGGATSTGSVSGEINNPNQDIAFLVLVFFLSVNFILGFLR